MKRINKLSAVIDGVSVEVDLKYPLPSGFRLYEVLSGEDAKTAMGAMGHADYVAKAEVQIRADDRHAGNWFVSYHFVGPDKFVTLASVSDRHGTIKHYMFAFEHRGIGLITESKHLINEAISTMFTEFNFHQGERRAKGSDLRKSGDQASNC